MFLFFPFFSSTLALLFLFSAPSASLQLPLLFVCLSLSSWFFPPQTYSFSLSRAVLVHSRCFPAGFSASKAAIFSTLLPRHSPIAYTARMTQTAAATLRATWKPISRAFRFFLIFQFTTYVIFHSQFKIQIKARYCSDRDIGGNCKRAPDS